MVDLRTSTRMAPCPLAPLLPAATKHSSCCAGCAHATASDRQHRVATLSQRWTRLPATSSRCRCGILTIGDPGRTRVRLAHPLATAPAFIFCLHAHPSRLLPNTGIVHRVCLLVCLPAFPCDDVVCPLSCAAFVCPGFLFSGDDWRSNEGVLMPIRPFDPLTHIFIMWQALGLTSEATTPFASGACSSTLSGTTSRPHR